MVDNEILLSDTSGLSGELEKAWGDLVASRVVDYQQLRPQIAHSWKRSLSYDVDPLEPYHIDGRESLGFIYEKNRLLLDVANDYLQDLHHILHGHDYLVLLIDAEGYILQTIGDSKIVIEAESVHLRAGTKSTEDSLGTTAAGICHSQRIPVQVSGYEHYCQVYHNWCCSSAPIFTVRQGLEGILNVASVNGRRHSLQLLSLIQMTARCIGTDINHRIAKDNYYKTKYCLASIVDNSPQPMLIFDGSSNLTHFNQPALKILQARTNDLIGRKAGDLIAQASPGRDAGEGEGEGGWTNMLFRVTSREVRVGARAVKLSDSEIEPLGTMLLLRGDEAGPRGALSLPLRFGFEDVIHSCPSMGDLVCEAKTMAPLDHSILLEGESGTGKEMLAQAIHNESPRKHNPFIALNCAALPRDLIQSELFGYESGAFTGANRSGQAGKFEQANGGTIFLDEIGDMPLEAQANLLRVLQEKCLVRIGGSRSRPLDVRVIAATNRNSLELVKSGQFRLDLYYRLSVISLHIPPLRERVEDLWRLIEHFIVKHGGGRCYREIAFEPEARRILEAYSWPGNIRELENAVIFALAKMKDNMVTVQDLPVAVLHSSESRPEANTLDEMENDAIAKVLAHCGGNVTKAARLLGISRATLYRKLKKRE